MPQKITASRKTACGVALLALFASCRGGCSRNQAAERACAQILAYFPAETRMVLSLDVAAARRSRFWKGLSEIAVEGSDGGAPENKAIEEFRNRTGLDPFRQIHRVVAAFPDDARRGGEFALLVLGEGFDEKRLVAYARDQAALAGGKIEQRLEGGRVLWTSSGSARAAGFFVDSKTFRFGAGGWGERMARIETGASAAQNGELESLCGRVERYPVLWFAALVPNDVRKALAVGADAGPAVSVMRLGGGIDLGATLDAHVVVELATGDDARALVHRIETSMRDAKGNAKVLMLGLGPYLDAVTVRADGPRVSLTLSLPESQVIDLLGRLRQMTKLARGKGQR